MKFVYFLAIALVCTAVMLSPVEGNQQLMDEHGEIRMKRQGVHNGNQWHGPPRGKRQTEHNGQWHGPPREKRQGVHNGNQWHGPPRG